MALKFIITVGISGSGKSTWIKQNGSGYNIISPDSIREELTGNVSDNTRNSEVFSIAFNRVAESLNNGISVIFDATNTVSRLRREMIEKINGMVDSGVEFTPIAKIFNCSPDICKGRIKKDIENKVNRSNVPDSAVDRQYNQFKNDIGKIESDGYQLAR